MSKNYTNFALALACLFQGANAKVHAQNLVPNPGFEVQDTCPAVSQIELAQPWNSPTLGTPDLFNNTCGSQQGSPHTGHGSAGLYTYSTFADNREYLQVQLTSPLVAGQTYEVSFYVKRLTFYSYAVNRIGAYFTSSEVDLTSTSALTSLTPQVEHTTMLNGTAYTLISGTFTATGGEQYMLIGNFRNDAGTTFQDVESNGNNKSYYYIDDLSVTLSASTAGLDQANGISLRVYPNPSSGIVHLMLDGMPSGDVTIELYDAEGRLVIRELYGSDAQRMLDLSSFDKGIYVARVYAGTGFIANERIILR